MPLLKSARQVPAHQVPPPSVSMPLERPSEVRQAPPPSAITPSDSLAEILQAPAPAVRHAPPQIASTPIDLLAEIRQPLAQAPTLSAGRQPEFQPVQRAPTFSSGSQPERQPDLRLELEDVVTRAMESEARRLTDQVARMHQSFLTDLKTVINNRQMVDQLCFKDILLHLEEMEKRHDEAQLKPDSRHRSAVQGLQEKFAAASKPKESVIGVQTRLPAKASPSAARKHVAIDLGSLQGVFQKNGQDLRKLDVMVCLLIVLSTIFLGVRMEFETRAALRKEHLHNVFRLLDSGLSTAFIVEFLIRFFVERQRFFCGRMRWWNLFDGLLLAVDLMSRYYHTEKRMMLLRIIRLPRLARCVGMLRLASSVNSLRVFFKSLRQSIPFIIWAFIGQFMILYIGAIVVGSFVISAIHEEQGGKNFKEFDELIAHHGSMGQSMVTLFMVATGGLNFKELVKPLKYNPQFEMFVVGWLIFARFAMAGGMAAAMLAFMATSATKIQRKEQSLRYWAESSPINDFKAWLQQAGTGSDPDMTTWKELESVLAKPGVAKMLRKIELDPDVVRGLFRLLDSDGSEDVSTEELIVSMSRSRDPVDVITMMYENRRLSTRILSLADDLESGMEDLHAKHAEHSAKTDMLLGNHHHPAVMN